MRAEKEKHLCEVIASCKEHLQNFKIARSTNLGGKGWLGEQIRKRKTILTACKHELHRIKGMDNIAIIKGAWYEDVAESNLGYCKCGNLLIEVGVDKKPWDVYCRKCGRKIVWREQ